MAVDDNGIRYNANTLQLKTILAVSSELKALCTMPDFDESAWAPFSYFALLCFVIGVISRFVYHSV